MKKNFGLEHFHIAAASGIFFALLLLLYSIAGRHNHRFDLTRGGVHSVSRQTVDVLNRMRPGEIMVRAFFSEDDPSRRNFEVLLKELATLHPRFRYEFYDPDRSPSQARRFRVDAYQTVLVGYEKREERLTALDEEAFTNALIRLAHPERQTLCFTTSHGEAGLSDSDRGGLSEWKQALEGHLYETEEIEILGKGIPDRCSAVVIAGPHYELLPRELDFLQRYPEKGKGLLLLIDPMDPGTGTSFYELVGPFGLRLGDDVVVDKVSRVFGGDYLVPLITQYADHPVTRKFRVATFLPITRTVRKAADVPPGLKVTELALTMPGSWAETNLERLEEGEAELNPQTDRVGPVPVAGAVEMLEAVKGARVVVVGDSDFVTNAHLNVSGNKDFAFNLIRWLVRDERWIAIAGREPRFEPLFLKLPQTAGVTAFTVGGFPLAFLLAGSIGIWVRRRKSG